MTRSPLTNAIRHQLGHGSILITRPNRNLQHNTLLTSSIQDHLRPGQNQRIPHHKLTCQMQHMRLIITRSNDIRTIHRSHTKRRHQTLNGITYTLVTQHEFIQHLILRLQTLPTLAEIHDSRLCRHEIFRGNVQLFQWVLFFIPICRDFLLCIRIHGDYCELQFTIKGFIFVPFRDALKHHEALRGITVCNAITGNGSDGIIHTLTLRLQFHSDVLQKLIIERIQNVELQNNVFGQNVFDASDNVLRLAFRQLNHRCAAEYAAKLCQFGLCVDIGRCIDICWSFCLVGVVDGIEFVKHFVLRTGRC
mmetsp:Transcript_19694/g.29291  ORF Transcript_19694/g.29291 Transcript_19694/m.29291 type:complete len:306 (-) Transcript_19694:2053-2970(-)